MGRQTAIVATEVDELALVHFLRATADIRILRAAAPTPQQLWFNELPPYDKYNTQFFFWNAAFEWEPDLVEVAGGVRVSNMGRAPVIELDRTDVEHFVNPQNRRLIAVGRLYWTKYFTASTLAYDVNRFDKWFTSVIRWVRKNGRRATEVTGAPYLLPDAWQQCEDLSGK